MSSAQDRINKTWLALVTINPLIQSHSEKPARLITLGFITVGLNTLGFRAARQCDQIQAALLN